MVKQIVKYKDNSQLSIVNTNQSYCLVNCGSLQKPIILNDIHKTYTICDNIIINYTPPDDVHKSILLYVSQSDIDASVNNIVRKLHNLNTTYVDVSVFDQNNKEIMLGLTIVNANVIDLDFSRISIPTGVNWKILVEV